ncbi:Mitochondrial genome maintenance exonuclease 1, partial [Eschrichtius robustus]|nr:Mitochondrial genome maintenance exonuclease 1 [Eschrichtius robustus]
MFLQGKRFHEALESILSPQGNLKEPDENLLKSGYIQSIQHVLRDVSGVQALESAVKHETLKYVGLLDCVADYQGKLCVIDWKTSEKRKPFIQNTFDNPLQVVAYVGAVNHDINYSFQRLTCHLCVLVYPGPVFHRPVLGIELGAVPVDCFVLSVPWSKKEMDLSSGAAVEMLELPCVPS